MFTIKLYLNILNFKYKASHQYFMKIVLLLNVGNKKTHGSVEDSPPLTQMVTGSSPRK